MTKKNITRRITERLDIRQRDAQMMVQQVLNAVAEVIASEQRIELRKFGVFEVKRRAARKVRNMSTGETMMMKERDTVVFRPSAALEKRVRAAIQKKNNAKKSK